MSIAVPLPALPIAAVAVAFPTVPLGDALITVPVAATSEHVGVAAPVLSPPPDPVVPEAEPVFPDTEWVCAPAELVLYAPYQVEPLVDLLIAATNISAET